MKIDGSCHCGRITYEAEVDPASGSICNCTDCQAFSGSPWRASVRALPADFRMTGEPKLYIKTADSGRKRAQAFCGECGSPIYATEPDTPVAYNIRLGSVRQRAELPPLKQLCYGSALPWAQDISGLPRG